MPTPRRGGLAPNPADRFGLAYLFGHLAFIDSDVNRFDALVNIVGNKVEWLVPIEQQGQAGSGQQGAAGEQGQAGPGQLGAAGLLAADINVFRIHYDQRPQLPPWADPDTREWTVGGLCSWFAPCCCDWCACVACAWQQFSFSPHSVRTEASCAAQKPACQCKPIHVTPACNNALLSHTIVSTGAPLLVPD